MSDNTTCTGRQAPTILKRRAAIALILGTFCAVLGVSRASAYYTGWGTPYQVDGCRWERQYIFNGQYTGSYQCRRTCYPSTNWRNGAC